MPLQAKESTRVSAAGKAGKTELYLSRALDLEEGRNNLHE